MISIACFFSTKSKTNNCLFSYCLDKNDRKEESEEEIWAGDDQKESPSPVSKPSSSKDTSKSTSALKNVAEVTLPSVHTSSKTNLVEPEEEDYGGSTEVDEVDTDDEIDM